MLANMIAQHAAASALAGDWAAVAQTLSAATLVNWDSRPVSYARITTELGDDVRQLVAGTLRTIAGSGHPLAGEVADAHAVLLNELVGLRIDNETRQATIDQVAAAGQWPDAVRDSIKSRGKRLVSIAGSPVTADECREAWEAAESEQQRAALRSRLDAALNQIRTVEHPLAVATLRTIADELESL